MIQIRDAGGAIIKGYASIDFHGFKITMATDDGGCRIYRGGVVDKRMDSFEEAIMYINEIRTTLNG